MYNFPKKTFYLHSALRHLCVSFPHSCPLTTNTNHPYPQVLRPFRMFGSPPSSPYDAIESMRIIRALEMHGGSLEILLVV
jgi:hypothetical protein